MNIRKLESGNIGIELQRTELRWFSQALNECCNGFRIKNFEATTGVEETVLLSMLDDIGEMYQAPAGYKNDMGIVKISEEKFQMTLTQTDARVFINCMSETIKTLGDWEYQTRMGAKVEQIEAVIASLRDALR